MKQIFLILIFCLAFQIVAFGQSENLPCPKVSVTGPESLIYTENPEPMIFTASVENKSENLKLEYIWTVTAGEMIEGQGTSILKVDVKNLKPQNITATVEIKGLPANCLNKTSDYGIVARLTNDNCLDVYRKISQNRERGYLDNFIAQMRNDPKLLLRFTLSFNGKPTTKEIDSRISRIAKHFAYRKAFDEIKRVVFVFAEDTEEYTRICHFSVNDKDAYCDDCKMLKGADIDLSKYSKSKRK